MSGFGVGVYFLTVLWIVALMLCWVSVRTGHSVGKIAVVVSFILTITLVCLPKNGSYDPHGANFYDSLFIPRYVILSLLGLSGLVGCVYCFIHVCLVPVETHKARGFGNIY